MNPYLQNLQNSNSADKIPYLRKGQVHNIYYPDDEDNISKKHIEYDVLLFDDFGGQTTLQRVSKSDLFSSPNDHEYTTLQENTIKDITLKPEERDGSYVLIGFLNGNINQPVILGGLDHPGLEPKTSKNKKHERFSEYNGISTYFNSKGEFEIALKGLKDSEGTLINSDQVPIVFKIGLDESVSIEDSTYFKFLLTSNKLLIETPKEQKIIIDDDEEIINIEHKSQSKILMESSGNVSVVDSSGGTFKASSGKLGVGNSSAELLDLFDKTLVQFDEVLTKILALTVPTALGPSGVPINSPDFVLIKTEVNTIKTNLGLIKGSI